MFEGVGTQSNTSVEFDHIQAMLGCSSPIPFMVSQKYEEVFEKEGEHALSRGRFW